MLWANVELKFVRDLIAEIPTVESSESHVENGILSSIFYVFGFWYHENRYIEQSKSTIETIRGKYASIEFVMKNNE